MAEREEGGQTKSFHNLEIWIFSGQPLCSIIHAYDQFISETVL